MKEYDLIIIGTGSAGLVAATTGHRKGLKTALVEKNKIGGECTHYGCVPSSYRSCAVCVRVEVNLR